MIIKFYTTEPSEGTEYYQVISVPNEIKNISMNLYDKKSDGIGTITMYWEDNTDYDKSECVFIKNYGYIVVNEKDKFVIKNRQDFINFYKYLTDDDFDLFIKQFKCIDKEHSMESDF